MAKPSNIIIKNVYYMLSYAFQTLNQSAYEELSKESFDNIHSLFSAILAKGLSLQLKQGLYKEYINKQEELSTLRGKINMPLTMRNILSQKNKLTCEYDELSEDNLMNQVIKATVLLLIRNENVKKEYKDILKKEMLFFSSVSDIDLHNVRWNLFTFNKNTQNYRLLISICELVVEGMLMTTEKGEYKLSSFIDEQRMCRLYEKFILEYYKKHYPELHPSASQIEWSLDDGSKSMLPIMQTDIYLRKGTDVLIIDAKYYSNTTQVQFDKHTIHSANIYQIFTYVKNEDYRLENIEHKVSGMLLYAKTDEEIQPNSDYQMHGNTISVRTLDLNKEFKDIKKQLDSIVKGYY